MIQQKDLGNTNVYYSSQESPCGKYDTFAMNNFTRPCNFNKLYYMTTIHIRLPYLPRTTPVISGCSFPSLEQNRMSSTESSRTVRVGYFFISSCMLVRYWSLSICALNPHTADPFLLFSTRYWMPDTSAKRRYSKCMLRY